MIVEWRDVPSIPGYMVSNDGQIKHRFHDAPRKLQRGSHGYFWCGFRRDNKNFVRTVHALVAEAFIGPRPDGAQVRHLDGDKSNNCAFNLAYGTAKENALDREWHGNTCRGERNGNASLSDDDVEEIRRLYEQTGRSQYDLAREFKISQAQVNNILLHKQRKRRAA